MIYRRDWRFVGVAVVLAIPVILVVDWLDLNLGMIGLYAMAAAYGLFGIALVEWDERRTGIRARIRENRRRSRAQAARTR